MKVYLYIMLLWLGGLALARYYVAADIRRHLGPGLMVSYAILTFAAVVVGNPMIFFGLCFCCFFIGVRTPIDAGCRFLLLTAMVPNLTMWVSPGGMYVMDLQPTEVFAVAMGIVCAAHGRWWRGGARRFSSEDMAVTALVLVTAFGATRGFGATSLARQLAALLFAFLPFVLLRRYSSKPEEMRALIGAIMAAGAILAIIAVYEAFKGWSVFDVFWMRLEPGDQMSRNVRIRGGLLRAPATFAESTSFAVFQLSAMAIAMVSRGSFRSKPRWLMCCGQIGIGLLAAQSRGALLGLFAAIAVTFLFRRAYAKAAGMIIAAGTIVTALLVLSRTNGRINSFMQADAALVGEDYRQRLFRRGLEEGFRNLWFGSDVAQLRVALVDMVQGEHIVDFVNSYLSLFLFGGLVGLAAFLVPLVMTYAKLWRRLGQHLAAGAREQHLAAVAMLTAVLTALGFTSLYERNPLWLILALTFAMAMAYRDVPVAVARRDLAPAF